MLIPVRFRGELIPELQVCVLLDFLGQLVVVDIEGPGPAFVLQEDYLLDSDGFGVDPFRKIAGFFDVVNDVARVVFQDGLGFLVLF